MSKSKPLSLLYIEARQDFEFQLTTKEIKKLPKKLFLAYSLQYKTLAESIKKQLQAKNIKIEKFQQVLGCSRVKTNLPIFLVSTGKFHAQNLFLQAPIIYVLENKQIIKVSKETIIDIETKKKTALMKYLGADNIGILVSTKPGQHNLKQALTLKNALIKKNKQAHLFLSNNIDQKQFENFQIDSWVNTACSGLSMDNYNLININEIPK
jgi:2-(3-amino-3-carboxypropyl)histidine synthase